jgi:hypothetical protein
MAAADFVGMWRRVQITIAGVMGARGRHRQSRALGCAMGGGRSHKAAPWPAWDFALGSALHRLSASSLSGARWTALPLILAGWLLAA